MAKALKNPEWVEFKSKCEANDINWIENNIQDLDSITRKKFILNHFGNIIPINNTIIHKLFYKGDIPILNYCGAEYKVLRARLDLNTLDKVDLKIILFDEVSTAFVILEHDNKRNDIRKLDGFENYIKWDDFEKETDNGWKIENNKIIPYNKEKDCFQKFHDFAEKRIGEMRQEHEDRLQIKKKKEEIEATKLKIQKTNEENEAVKLKIQKLNEAIDEVNKEIMQKSKMNADFDDS